MEIGDRAQHRADAPRPELHRTHQRLQLASSRSLCCRVALSSSCFRGSESSFPCFVFRMMSPGPFLLLPFPPPLPPLLLFPHSHSPFFPFFPAFPRLLSAPRFTPVSCTALCESLSACECALDFHFYRVRRARRRSHTTSLAATSRYSRSEPERMRHHEA